MTEGADVVLPDDEVLYHRIHPSQLVMDENRRQWRVSSGDWDDATGNVSVYVKSLMDARGLAPEVVLEGYASSSLVSITAGEARKLGFSVAVVLDLDDPIPLRGECHGEMAGLLPGKAGRKQQRKPLAAQNEMIILRPPAQSP